MASVAIAASTVLVVGPNGSGKTTLINLLARKVVRPPNNDFIPVAVSTIDLEAKDCIVPFLGNAHHFYVRFLECPGFPGSDVDDTAVLQACRRIYTTVSDLCASILVVVPFLDQLNPSLDTFLKRLLPLIKLCAGKKITFVLTKVDTAAQFYKATHVIGPGILAYLRAQLSGVPVLVDFMAIGTGSIDVAALRPEIEKSLIVLGNALQVIPPARAAPKRKPVTDPELDPDAAQPPVSKVPRPTITAPPTVHDME